MPADRIWVLRAHCGCPCGASSLAADESEAWAALAGDRLPYEQKGYTVEAEPAERARADVRANLGRCTHRDAPRDPS
jgi:hypothetical protein